MEKNFEMIGKNMQFGALTASKNHKIIASPQLIEILYMYIINTLRNTVYIIL